MLLDQSATTTTAGAQTFEGPAVAVSRPERWRRIGIVGFGATARATPVADPDVELWGMNGLWRVSESDFKLNAPEERWSLWLDMHSLGFTRQYGHRAGIGDKQEKWLEQPHPFTILSVETRPEWPSVQAYPIEALVKRFNRDYFTSTIAYGLALAISLPDVAEISLWGIDLIDDTEYSDQRPCAEYWIGRAEAMGIKIVIPEESALLKQRARYGYDDASSPLLRELRQSLAEQGLKLAEATKQKRVDADKAMVQANTDDGAVQMIQMILARLDKWERGGRI